MYNPDQPQSRSTWPMYYMCVGRSRWGALQKHAGFVQDVQCKGVAVERGARWEERRRACSVAVVCYIDSRTSLPACVQTHSTPSACFIFSDCLNSHTVSQPDSIHFVIICNHPVHSRSSSARVDMPLPDVFHASDIIVGKQASAGCTPVMS